MYLTHFGLQDKPFKASPDPKYLWLGARQKEAQAALVAGILGGEGFQVVTGDAGTGKTTLANAALKELGDRVVAVAVPCPEYEGIDFFKLIAKAYGIGGPQQDHDSLVARISDFVRRSFSSGKRVALIIDDAHRLNSPCLKELLDLSRIEENGTRPLLIVFFGENRFQDILIAEANRELSQEVTSRYTLDPLTKDETAQYIVHRLEIAGCEREIFTPEAIEEIFHYSQGVPSLINKACDVALSRNFFLGQSVVLPESIRNFLKLMPEEKTATAGNAPDAAPGPSVKKASDDDRAGIEKEAAWKLHGNRIAYAALGCFLAVAVGFTLFVTQSGEKPEPAKMEAKKEAPPPESPPASAGTIRGSDTTARPQAPSAAGEVRATGGASAQAVRAKRRQAAGTGTTAGQDGRVTREAPPRRAAEEPDPDKVIDWLLKKRAEKQ
jgi:type II secretory pathway predicted ATPase ExeA